MIAISTAYKEALIGIEIDEKVNFRKLDSNCKHSENILYSVDQMLNEIDKTINENDYYSVIVGPGSFTGLRIGIALIKGLMAGDKARKLIPLTTFDLLAYSYIKNFTPTDDFVCIINGLSGYYFICKYSCKGEKLSQEKMIDQTQFSQIFEKTVGLAEEGIAQENISPSPQELLELAKEKNNENNLISAYDVMPIYLRKSQAESNLEGNK